MEKIELYQTAYSPLYKQYVKITAVKYDTNNQPIIYAFVGNQEVMFRQYELTDYCL